MCGSPCAMLWTRPRDPEPGALPGRAGEKAGSHGGLDAPAAVAADGSMAGMLGPDLASVGAAPRQECRDAEDDRAGARGFGGGMGPSHSGGGRGVASDRKSTRLNSSHRCISYAVFCLKKKKKKQRQACQHRCERNDPSITTPTSAT